MPGPQFLGRANFGRPIKPRLLLREKRAQPDVSILISAICNGLSVLGILAQPFVHTPLYYMIASSLFLFGGIAGCLAAVVGVREARALGRTGTKLGLYMILLGLLLGLIAYASFMLQLNNFNHEF